MTKFVYTYKVVKCACKKKWKGRKKIENVYDKLVDERRNDKMGEISCGCCMPPKDIIIKLVSKRLPKKDGKR